LDGLEDAAIEEDLMGRKHHWVGEERDRHGWGKGIRRERGD